MTERRSNLRAAALVAPLLVLILAAFVAPIGHLLWKAVDNGEVAAALPRTSVALAAWDGGGLPPEAAFAALAADIRAADANETLGTLARRLNFEQSGFRRLLLSTTRALDGLAPPFAAALAGIDPRWSEPATWQLLKRNAAPVTPLYLLNAIDLTLSADGRVVAVDPGEAIFVGVFLRTFEIGIGVTLICLLLGYPLAHFMATLPPRRANLALILVLLPFWTSLLVRTTSWFILLQNQGPFNAALVWSGLSDGPIQMIFTRFAVYVAVTHVTLPFVVLPLYAVMRRIDPDHLRAAASLGAPPVKRFLRIYLPLTMPGVAAGALLAFVLAIGFYVTPALVGGTGDQLVSYFIAYFVNRAINWGMAAALATLLLLATGVVVTLAYWSLPALRRGALRAGP